MENMLPDFNEVFSPNIRVAMNHQSTNDYILLPRVIFDYELMYITRGTLRVIIEDRVYQAGPGDLVLIKPGLEHSFAAISTESLGMPHLHFDLVYYEDFKKLYTSFKPYSDFTEEEKQLIRPDLLSTEEIHIPEIIQVHNHEVILNLLMDIIEVHQHKDLYYQMKEKQLFIQLFYNLMTALTVKRDISIKKNIGKLDEIRDYIVKNVNRKLTLEELSRISCLSIFHLERLFKKYYGMPLLKYQQNRRMEMAIELMLYTKMSHSNIAEKVGFSSIHSFSKAFKKVYGLSPRKYVNNAYLSQKF